MQANALRMAALSAACTVLLQASALPARAAEAQWRSLPIRSQEEFEQGLPGGQSEQFMHDMARSASNPDRIYLAHDMGGVWRTDDNGRTWNHTLCHGLHAVMYQSMEADPVNPDVVFVLVGSGYDYQLDHLHGIYRSEDAGRTWKVAEGARRIRPRPDAYRLPGEPHET